MVNEIIWAPAGQFVAQQTVYIKGEPFKVNTSDVVEYIANACNDHKIDVVHLHGSKVFMGGYAKKLRKILDAKYSENNIKIIVN